MKSKQIGILTTHQSANYGAMFQCYALQEFLKQSGHEPFIVNYHLDVPSMKGYLSNPVAFAGKIISKGALSLGFFKKKSAEIKGKSIEREFTKIFLDFKEDYLNIKGAPLNYDDLVLQCPEADAFIVGSDQVWSTDFVFSKPAYLLAFTRDDHKKIAYAPSFGKKQLEPFLRPVFKRHIKNFDAVSVREKTGVEIVKRLSGIDAVHAVDPTLLMSDYSGLIDYSLVPNQPYIFTYRLGQEQDLSQWFTKSIQVVEAERGHSVFGVTTNSTDHHAKYGHQLKPTPGQLLGLIEKADFVLTNSFHGTIFSVHLNTPFLTLARDGEPDKQNLRMTDLLSELGLSSNFCPAFASYEEIQKAGQAATDLQYEFGNLHGRIEMSKKFLLGALE